MAPLSGFTARAAALYDQALAASRELGYRLVEVQILAALGTLRHERGDAYSKGD